MVDRRTFIGLAGMVGLSLAGCGAGNAVTQSTDSPQATEVEQTPSEKPAQPRVTEYCFSTDDYGYSYWTAIVENPNTSYAATYMSVRATAYDENGAILGTSDDSAQILLPQHKVAFCRQFGEYSPASIEVEVAPLNDNEFAAWDLDSNGDPKFEVANLNETNDGRHTRVTGTVHNDFTQKTDIWVVIALRDSEGKLVDGMYGYAEDATPQDDTAFEAEAYYIAHEHASIEGYANPIVPR